MRRPISTSWWPSAPGEDKDLPKPLSPSFGGRPLDGKAQGDECSHDEEHNKSPQEGIGLGPESTGAFQRMTPKYAAQLMNNSATIPQIHCLTLSPPTLALATCTRNTSAGSFRMRRGRLSSRRQFFLAERQFAIPPRSRRCPAALSSSPAPLCPDTAFS